MRDFAANSIAAAVGIILAVQGFGIWAVVANSLLVNLLNGIFIWRVTPHRIDLRRAEWKAVRELWDFGSKIFGYTLLKHILRNTDSVLIGAMFGPEKLGLYNFAQRVTMAPTKGIQAGIATFLFPKASKLQDDPDGLKELYLLAYKSLNYLLLVFSFVMVTSGVEILPLVFGKQWAEAIPLVRILILVLLLGPALAPLGELMKATNRPGWLFNWALFLSGATTAGLAAGLWFGFTGSVVGLVASHVLTLPAVIWMVRRITLLTASEFWARLRVSYLLSIFVGAAHYVVWWRWQGNVPILASAGAALAAVHIGAAYFLDTDVKRIRRMLFRGTSRDIMPVPAETSN